MTDTNVFILRRALRRLFNRAACAVILLLLSGVITYSCVNYATIYFSEKSPYIVVYGHINSMYTQGAHRYYFSFTTGAVFDLMLDQENAALLESALSMNDAVKVTAKETIFGRYLVKNIESPYLLLNPLLLEQHHRFSKQIFAIQSVMGLVLLALFLFEYISFYAKMQWFSNRPKRADLKTVNQQE